jgi:hypothetical protein
MERAQLITKENTKEKNMMLKLKRYGKNMLLTKIERAS